LGAIPRLAAAELRDLSASVEKLQRDAADATLIRHLATDKVKREIALKLAALVFGAGTSLSLFALDFKHAKQAVRFVVRLKP
jgi:hypothetical protein